MKGRLSRSDLAEAFTAMGETLAGTRTVADIAVHDGSPVLLQMQYFQATENLECAVALGDSPVKQAMTKTRRQFDLPIDWLKDGLSPRAVEREFSADVMPFGQYPSSDRPFLRVIQARPEYVLAMIMAALERSSAGNVADVSGAASALGIVDIDAAKEIYHRFFPWRDRAQQPKPKGGAYSPSEPFSRPMWTGRPQSLARAAAVPADDRWCALNECMDEFYLADRDVRTQQTMIDQAPEVTGDPFIDAFYAATAEHLALRWKLDVPIWSYEPKRMGSDRPTFMPNTPAIWPMLLVASPYAFRRRNIFTGREPLQRARWPSRETKVQPLCSL